VNLVATHYETLSLAPLLAATKAFQKRFLSDKEADYETII